jgi:hypothetical protein
MQAHACIIQETVYNAGMVARMHMHERPGYLSVAGAFLCAEAWQSGLLHRAYPSADLWASKPLTGSRQFESDRFHHQTSGTVTVEAATAPDHQPRDLAPKKMTASRNIAPNRSAFQKAAHFPQLTDLARHELPPSRKAN